MLALLLVGLLSGGACFGQESAKPALPRVDTHIDPAKSFWLDHVHYPYPTQFARVADGQGRQWEIAYMDVFRGTAEAKAKAPVLVLLHGRAVNSGYWGELMEKPLAAGWRVVAVDWGNSGKSLPKNLDLPVVRSFDDVRQVVFNLVVRHLGIAKSSMLGHSMGGQLAAGYALRYPEHVEHLVLYGSGGLGLLPPIEWGGFRFDDPELVKQPGKFLAAWKSGILFPFSKTQEEVETSFYVPARSGAMAYLQRGDNKLGEFIVASRAGILRGNPRERERFEQAYAWDSLAALSECRAEDGNALPNRLAKLKVPTLVAMGMKESVLPLDPLPGLFQEARRNKAPIIIKLYENAGHFIHTDLPEQFSADVLAFLQTEKVPEPLFAGEFAKRTPLAELPDDVRRFKERAEAAWAKSDINAVRHAIYHPQFRDDGQTLQQRLDSFAPWFSMNSHYKMLIYAIKPLNDGLILDVEIINSFGSFPNSLVMKKMDGEWYYYGNQK